MEDYFIIQNKGLRSPQIASLAISPDDPSVIYAGTGDQGGSGGLFVSLDGGESWGLTGAGESAQFAGNHSRTADPVPDGHPRSNGNLIGVVNGTNPNSTDDDLIIVGTYNDGVKIYTEGGDTLLVELENSASDPGFVRSIAVNSEVEGKAFAAIYFNNQNNNGIYEIDFSDEADVEFTLAHATSNPEEVVLLGNGHVYAVVGSDGLVGNTGGGWETLNDGLEASDSRVWAAITGYVNDDGEDVLYATVNNSDGTAGGGSNYSSVWRSEDGGADWSALVDRNENVSTNIYDGTVSGGESWWFQNAFSNALLGRRQTSMSSIEVLVGDLRTPEDDIIYVSGRGGIWKSPNGGRNWYPSVNNMQVTANRAVAVNPGNPADIMVGNTDFVVLHSTDALSPESVVRDRPNGSDSRGFDVFYDHISEMAFSATGDRSFTNDTEGRLYYKEIDRLGNPRNSGWTDMRLQDFAGGSTPQAVVAGHHDGTSFKTEAIVLAAVRNKGVYRYFDGSWTQSTGVTIGNSERSRLHWPDSENSGVVFLLDLDAGLFGSVYGGQSWEEIWSGLRFNNANFFLSGFIAGSSPDSGLTMTVESNTAGAVTTVSTTLSDVTEKVFVRALVQQD